MNIGITTEDKEILKNNPVDFISFSYSSRCISTQGNVEKLLEMLLRELKTHI